jgi:hypothetical protein
MNVRKIPGSDTGSTISFTWDRVIGADGYRFYSAGVLRSKTFDPTRRTVRFSKGQEPYEVEAIVLTPIDRGRYPADSPPPPTYVKVAPITVVAEGASDQRVSLKDASGNLRPGVSILASGEATDESGAKYNGDLGGLENSSVRTKLRHEDYPELATAKAMDGRSADECPPVGDPTKNTGSWTV